MRTETHNMGRTVLCDICNEDWTDRPESGGFIFESKAYCPDCARESLPSIIAYNEQHFIRASCPAGLAFPDFVRQYRGGDGQIIVSSFDSIHEMWEVLASERKENGSS